MPRSERRRWWLERDIRGWSLILDDDPPWRAGSVDDEMPQGRGVVSLWRLAQWHRIRQQRLIDLGASQQVHFTKRAQTAERGRDVALLDADAAVLEARVSEEAMRVELDKYRAIANMWTAAVKAVKAPKPMPMIELDDDIGCDYPDCDACGERDTCADRYKPPTDGMPF